MKPRILTTTEKKNTKANNRPNEKWTIVNKRLQKEKKKIKFTKTIYVLCM